MVLFGTTRGEKNRGWGEFFCPQCKSDQNYVHKEVVRKGHLYFIPLVELGSVGEYIECQRCGGQFTTDVLSLPTMASFEQRYTVAVRSALAAMIRADSVENENEKRAGRYLIKSLTGESVSAFEQQADLNDANQEAVRVALSDLSEHLTEKGKVQILEALIMLAASDGTIEESEMNMITQSAEAMGVPAQYLPGIVSSVLGSAR